MRERLKRFLEELLRYKDHEPTIFANHPKDKLTPVLEKVQR